MYGLLAAYWQHFHRSSWTQKARTSFGIGLVLFLLTKLAAETVFSRSVFFHCNLSFPLYALSIMLLLPYLSQIRKGSGWTYQALTRVSLISYSLYLIHSSLVIGLILNQYLFQGHWGPETRWLRLAAFWLLSIPLAEVMYRFIEIPFMKLRDRSGRQVS
jgi:peptidoglycan/LPS O-acetylase OafA/YrhL